MNKNFKTNLARAKGLGSSKHGFQHWYHQRLTGLFLIFFVIWAAYFINKSAQVHDLHGFLKLLKQPYNIMALIFFSITSFYHAALGLQVVIEDYIGNIAWRSFLIILMQLFSLVSATALVVTLLYIMFS